MRCGFRGNECGLRAHPGGNGVWIMVGSFNEIGLWYDNTVL